MPNNNNIDWDAIEVDYIAGVKAIRALAREHGIAESSIRTKANKQGWIRTSSKVKREIVRERIQEEAADTIDDAAEIDINDMRSGLENARKALQKISLMLELVEDARSLKSLSESNKINIDVIRNIRELDEPNNNDEPSIEDVKRLLEKHGFDTTNI